MDQTFEQRIEDAVASLTAWCQGAEDEYKLGPLELTMILANVTAVRIGHEAALEREGIAQMKAAFQAEPDPMAAELEPLPLLGEDGHPVCCQKHNMMGRIAGKCAGGPPGTRGGRRSGPEQAAEDTTAEGVGDGPDV